LGVAEAASTAIASRRFDCYTFLKGIFYWARRLSLLGEREGAVFCFLDERGVLGLFAP
jgi:hypothetical protein